MQRPSRLFEPVSLGHLRLPNRVLMAPLTRNRSNADGTPVAMATDYYRQRASAGLIFSEATQISAMGKGYIDTPGIYTQAHVDAWRQITDAVHAGGGRIFCQLWHVGRISHVSLLPEGRQPVSSTDKRADAQTFTADGFTDCSTPKALDQAGIDQTIADFATAAEKAAQAGFDGIEVHAANGYLLDQFLQNGVNDRTDEYGGSIDNRMRLLMQVLNAVSAHWPASSIGVRLSPLGQASDMSDSDPMALFSEVYRQLSERKLAYLHVVEKFPGSEGSAEEVRMMKELRSCFSGFYIANGDYDAGSAEQAVVDDYADAVAIGRPFIANPDLPERYRTGAALNAQDSDTFFGGGREGYTDYPFLDR